jgi:prepilin-type processing-associated H-X9-DG protein
LSLELNKLTHQVEALGRTLSERAAELDQSTEDATALFFNLSLDDALQRKVLRAKQGRWAGAEPTHEAVASAHPLPRHPGRANVLAADGSQIYPDRHSYALYYLINIGSIVFQHGLALAPAVRSRPSVYFEDADLYEEDGGRIRPSAMIDVQRSTSELEELAELAEAHAPAAPTVALLDNPLLLYVTLQTPDEELIARVIRGYLDRLDRLQAAGGAVAGVIDRPRAPSVVRLVHLSRLSLEEIDRERLSALGNLEHVTDRLLFRFLRPGERSALFVNTAPDNDRYRQRGHTVYFFYLNAGGQSGDSILRIEVPEWVALNRDKLDLVHAAVVEQGRLSGGFPYVLMRAHEQAVVTLKERRAFDEMVLGAMMRRGMAPSLSQKAQGKAWTGAGKRRFRT